MHLVGGTRVVVRAGAPILHDQRNLGLARRQIERGAQRSLVVVFDFDQAEQAAIRLACGQAVRVRVVPVQGSAIANFEVVGVAFAGCHERHARAVVARVVGESVPMRDRRLGESCSAIRSARARPGAARASDSHSRCRRDRPHTRVARDRRSRRRSRVARIVSGASAGDRRPKRPLAPGTNRAFRRRRRKRRRQVASPAGLRDQNARRGAARRSPSARSAFRKSRRAST